MSISRRIQEAVEVVIHSQYRNNPTTNSHTDFTYNLDREISRVSEIRIQSIHIPYSFYAINENNNILYINASTAHVPIGNYTSSTLITALISAMTAAGVIAPTVVYNSTTNKLTLGGSNTFMVSVSGDNNIAYTIGFAVDSLLSTSVTGDSVVDISGPKHLVLKSSLITQFTAEKNITAAGLAVIYVANTGVSDNILHTIPINSQPNGINIDIPIVSSSIRMNTLMKFQNNIDFRLEDDEGNLLDLNGKEWTMKLLFKVR